MTEEGMRSAWLCRECGRENRPPEPRCGFCSAPRPGATDIATTPSPARRPLAEADDDYPKPLGLSPFHRPLPAVTAYAIIIICAMGALVYGAGVALLIVLTPALYRLFRIARERSLYASSPTDRTAGQMFAIVAAASGIAFLVIVSSLITFTAVCLPTGTYAVLGLEREGYPTQVVVWTAGLLGGLALAGGLGYGITAAFFRSQKRADPRVPPGIDRYS